MLRCSVDDRDEVLIKFNFSTLKILNFNHLERGKINYKKAYLYHGEFPPCLYLHKFVHISMAGLFAQNLCLCEWTTFYTCSERNMHIAFKMEIEFKLTGRKLT